jgi:hypothetical protein
MREGFTAALRIVRKKEDRERVVRNKECQGTSFFFFQIFFVCFAIILIFKLFFHLLFAVCFFTAFSTCCCKLFLLFIFFVSSIVRKKNERERNLFIEIECKAKRENEICFSE